MTHYEVLGISDSASHQQIKQAYRTLVKLYHPDVNPSEDAKERIVQITHAYETLSDPYKRDIYDWQLRGTYIPEPEPVVNEYELRRKEYIRRKREQEQRHWEQMFMMKVRFYKYQRICAYPFILIALLFSIDYFFTPARISLELQEVKLNPAGYSVGKAGPFRFETDAEFYGAALSNEDLWISIHYSSIFEKPVGVGLSDGSYFSFHGTLHSYGNLFTYILLILSVFLLYNREYNDFAMTVGILPFFIVLFLFAAAL